MISFEQYVDNSFTLNGVPYLGADAPEYDPFAINEANFDSELRFKSVDAVWNDDVYVIDWTSQGVGDVDGLVDEVKRWKKAVMSGRSDSYDFDILLNVQSRDGDDLGSFDL